MAAWAFECTRCGDPQTRWYIAADTVAEFPPDTRIVQVKVKNRWLCAKLDLSKPVSINAAPLRMVIPTDAVDCDGCQDRDDTGM
jgi:hypothetical protein